MPIKWLGKHLMLKAKYAPLILNGSKKSTIRLGKVDVRNREFYINSGGKIIAKAVVKDVQYKTVRELTDEDAKLDGFKNREELIGELRRHYGKISDDDWVTIIIFDILEILNLDESGYGGMKPKQISELALKYLPLNEQEEMIHRKIIEYGSIRKAARKIYGSLQMRWKIRNALNKAYRELVERGIIKNLEDENSATRSVADHQIGESVPVEVRREQAPGDTRNADGGGGVFVEPQRRGLQVDGHAVFPPLVAAQPDDQIEPAVRIQVGDRQRCRPGGKGNFDKTAQVGRPYGPVDERAVVQTDSRAGQKGDVVVSVVVEVGDFSGAVVVFFGAVTVAV